MTQPGPTPLSTSAPSPAADDPGTAELDSFSEGLDAYVTPGRLDGLTDRLAAAAGNGLDVVWTTHETSLGPLLLAFQGDAVVRVAFEVEGFDAVVDDLGRRLGPRTLRAARPADALRRQLDAYLTGERQGFDVPFDLVLSSAPFRREVQQSLPTIAYGHTASYAEVAASAGRPKAVRAVGSACATNPLPLVLPCHRVLRSDGSLGQYLGGVVTKRALLDLEAEHVARSRQVRSAL